MNAIILFIIALGFNWSYIQSQSVNKSLKTEITKDAINDCIEEPNEQLIYCGSCYGVNRHEILYIDSKNKVPLKVMASFILTLNYNDTIKIKEADLMWIRIYNQTNKEIIANIGDKQGLKSKDKKLFQHYKLILEPIVLKYVCWFEYEKMSKNSQNKIVYNFIFYIRNK